MTEVTVRYITIKDGNVIDLINPVKDTGRINDNYTYLDYILDCINKGDFEYNIANITAPGKPDMKVDFYLDIAKHDMIGYVKDDLNLNILLKKYDNKTLLEYFLDRDTELTLNVIEELKKLYIIGTTPVDYKL